MDKVISFNNKKNKAEVFDYVKLNRDSNGRKFNEDKLLEYAEKCRYIVRIMKKINNEVCLYNFDVPAESLFNFLKSFEDDKLKGKIIEIEKFIPEDLA